MFAIDNCFNKYILLFLILLAFDVLFLETLFTNQCHLVNLHGPVRQIWKSHDHALFNCKL